MYLPFRIGSKFRITPPDSPAIDDGCIELIMQRGAFGSGEHETTVSCLESLEALSGLQGSRILDLGSGTGILAIAALKLGAAKAVCVDIDAEAVKTARRNGQYNDLNARIQHITGTLESVAANGFDLILANIYGDILIELAMSLAEKARPGARLLLSGILWEYNFDVRQAYRNHGCHVISNRMLEEFSTVLLCKE